MAMSVCEQAKGRGERQYTDKAADAAKKLASRFAELQGMIMNVRQRYQLRQNCKVGKRRGQLAARRRWRVAGPEQEGKTRERLSQRWAGQTRREQEQGRDCQYQSIGGRCSSA